MSMLIKDPLQVFHQSKTPAGLYARQKWLDQGGTNSWRRDFDSTVALLNYGQMPNGSWGDSVVNTVRHLFDLHLTVRKSNRSVDAGIDWLTASMPSLTSVCGDYHREHITAENLRGIPFSPCRFDVFSMTSALFLATVFGRDHDRQVIDAYDHLDREIVRKDGYLYGWSCLSNLLRALVVNDKYSNSRSTELIVQVLSRIQTPEGEWQGKVPFYLTLNALAHLDMPIANSQVDSALKRIYRTQSRNGSWGKAEPEFATFLVVHTLKRKGIL